MCLSPVKLYIQFSALGIAVGMVLAWPSPAAAQGVPSITSAQNPAWCSYSSATSGKCTYPSSNTSGNLLFAFQVCQGTTTIEPLADTAGNSWLPMNPALVNSGDSTISQAFYVQDAKGSANTMTYASSTKAFCTLLIWEVTNGIAGSWKLDQVQYGLNSGTNNTTLSSNATQALSQPNELVIGAGGEGGSPGNTFTAGNGFTIPSNGTSTVPSVTYAVESLQASTTSPQTATMSMHSSSNWEMYVATFTPPAAAGTPIITSVSPGGGPVGTVVTINGNNFGSSQGGSTVTFNGVAALPITWNSGSIQVAVPSGAATGYVSVMVGGSASNGMKFAVQGPIVSAQNPVWCSYKSNASSGTCAYRANNSVGDMLFGFEVCQSTMASIATPIDTAGNSWLPTQSPLVNKGDTTISQLFYVQNAKGGSNIVTYSSGQRAFCGFLIWELTNGVAGTWTLDQIASADNSGTNTTALSSGATGNLARSSELVVGVGGSGFNPSFKFTAGSGFTIPGNGASQVPSVSYAVEWLPSSSITPQTATLTISPASDWEMYVATFEPPLVRPVITSVTPGSDVTGAIVTIKGSNFGSVQGQSTVTFGGVSATPGSWSDTQITVPVPAGVPVGSDPIVVTTTQGASNSEAFTVAAPLVVVATSSPAPNTSGWNNSNVTITYHCSGGVPPVVCPNPQVVSTEGAKQVFTATATDADGNTAQATVTLNIDKTSPTITASVTPTPNGNSAVTAPVTITFTCSDATSGVASCPAPIIVTTLGANQSFSGTAVDVAGNSSLPATVTLSVEAAQLTIKSTLSSVPNAAGWFTQPVTVTYQCSGGILPVVCPSPQTISTQGGGQSITGTATDVSGQTAATVNVLNIDHISPTLSTQVSPAPNASGWNKSNVTVTYQCSDADSGVANCPSTQVISTEGANILVSGTAIDVAGNSAAANLFLSSDKTPPSVSVLSPLDGSNVTVTQVGIQGLVSDSGSGVGSVTCNGTSGTISGAQFSCKVTLVVGSNTVAVVVTDVAGNRSASSLGLIYSLPIHVQITSPAPLQLFSANPITVTGTVDDPSAVVTVGGVNATVSGGTFTAAGVVLRESKNLLTATATSPAGGIGSDSVTVYLDTTPPVVHIDSPATGTIVTAPQIDVTGNVNDFVTGTVNGDQVSVVVNGVNASVANRSFAAHGVLLVPGVNTVTAVAMDRAGNTSQFQIQVTLQQPEGRQTLVVVSGNKQTAPIRTLLPQSLAVQALDALGRPMANRTLTFTVSKSDGLMLVGEQQGRILTVQTDANGTASVQFQVGSRDGAGVNQVSVTAPGFVGQALFSADSTVGAPTQIHPVSGEMQVGIAGAPLAQPLIAIVQDSGGNPVANVPVTFTVTSGGGVIGSSTTFVQNTDGDGRASAVLVLGQLSGVNNNVVQATFGGQTRGAGFVSSGVVPGPASHTTVSGLVLNDANEPLPNVTASIKGTQLSARTNATGRFTITGAPVGDIVLFIDGSTSTDSDTYPTLSFQMVALPGVDNSLPGPIYLPEIDTSNSQVVGGDQDVVLTMSGVPGVAYKVFADSVTFPDGTHVGSLTLSQVHADKVPMTPPNGTAPNLVGTLQPAGVLFNPPVQMTLPNTQGLAPGQVTELFSFHHDVEQFVTEGTARVSADGSVIVSDPGFGLSVSGWHAGGGLPLPPDCVSNVTVDLTSIPDALAVGDNGTATAQGNLDSSSDGCPPSPGTYSWVADNPNVLQVSGSDSSASLLALDIMDADEVDVNLEVTYTDEDASAQASKPTKVVKPKLVCNPNPVVRGQNILCQVNNPPGGAHYANWTYTDTKSGTVVTRAANEPAGADAAPSWNGTMVVSGTMSVDVTNAQGKKTTYTNAVTVNPRSGFNFSPRPATGPVASGTSCLGTDPPKTLSVDPEPAPSAGDTEATIGQFCVNEFISTTNNFGQGGPNNGYYYVGDVRDDSSLLGDQGPQPPTQSQYLWTRTTGLDTPTATFASHQCRNFDPVKNPKGFISYNELLHGVVTHESGGTGLPSHYANYINTVTKNDIKQALESTIGIPPMTNDQFNQQVLGVVTPLKQQHTSDSQVEPCGGTPNQGNVNVDDACNFRGFVNFKPYAVCQ